MAKASDKALRDAVKSLLVEIEAMRDASEDDDDTTMFGGFVDDKQVMSNSINDRDGMETYVSWPNLMLCADDVRRALGE